MENRSSDSQKSSKKKPKLSGFQSASFLLGLIPGIVLVGVVWFVSSSPQEEVLPAEKITQADSCAIQEEIKIPSEVSEENRAEVLAYLQFKQIKESHIPSGVPDVYGEELSISFDEVQDAIDKVQIFGPTYGIDGKKIVLTGVDMERYIDVDSRISCEYCCGVKALIREDGSAACGCAHSIMMRGLTAYLIKNHPELSNEQILGELQRWKITYFPKQTLSAKLFQMEQAGEEGIRELLEEFPDFLPQMVGGC